MIEIIRKSAEPCRSAAVAAGDFIFVSGQVADDPSPDTKKQTAEVLRKIDGILADIGSDKSRLVFAQIWLADITDYDRMNEVWDAWIEPSAAPARAAVEARLAGPQYRVEIAAVALK